MNVYGNYNEAGYSIISEENETVYCAGNHALDSQQNGTRTQHQLSLQTIEEYCRQTAEEMAEEQGGKVLYIACIV